MLSIIKSYLGAKLRLFTHSTKQMVIFMVMIMVMILPKNTPKHPILA